MTKRKAASKQVRKKDINSELKFEFTKKQESIIEAVRDRDTKAVFINGPSGTSKTLLAVFCGLDEIINQTKDTLLYIRTAAESSQIKIGARPGDIDEKMNHLTIPLRDKLDEILGFDGSNQIMDSSKIQAMPVNDLRGSSWRDTYAILDEGQNASFEELLTTITRVGQNSKIILVGDSMQSDIRNSGWERLIRIFDNPVSGRNGVRVFELDEEDIVRSEFVKFVIKSVRENITQENFKKNLHRNEGPVNLGTETKEWTPSERKSAAQNGNGSKPS
jgi:phosphate starvation-inducible PhoH-like protein